MYEKNSKESFRFVMKELKNDAKTRKSNTIDLARIILAVGVVPEGLIKPYPPNLLTTTTTSSNNNNKVCKKIPIFPILFIIMMIIGIIIGLQWGKTAIIRKQQQQQQQLFYQVDNNNNIDDDDDGGLGTKWIPYGQRLDGGAYDNEFGEALDINGDATVLATGAYGYKDSTGTVKVMKCMNASSSSLGGEWIQMGNSIQGRFKDERFGSSVQLSRDGMILIVGAMGSWDDSEEDVLYGQVQSYRYNSFINEWIQIGPPVYGKYIGDRFGISLSVASNGKSWIVGADNNNNRNEQQQQRMSDDGYARVYELSLIGGREEWKQKGRTIQGSSKDNGIAVAMSGDGQTICIGDRNYKINESFMPGRALCFKWENNDWRTLGFSFTGDYHREQNGYSLALNEDGTVLAIGAVGHDSGCVRVYSLQAKNGIWKMMGERITGENFRDQIGFKVSLNKKGDVLAYTGRGYDNDIRDNNEYDDENNNNNNFEDTGVVRAKRWIHGVGWISLGDDIVGYEGGDHFGETLALNDDGTTLVSSANWDTIEYVSAFTLVQ